MLFYIFYVLLFVALIILNKTENHKEDLCLKIYALILVILICYLNLQHCKKKHEILDPVSTESTLLWCARLCQRSDKYARASWKTDVLKSTMPRQPVV